MWDSSVWKVIAYEGLIGHNILWLLLMWVFLLFLKSLFFLCFYSVQTLLSTRYTDIPEVRPIAES